MTPFAEIVAPPERGRVFAGRFRGGLADAAPSGRVRLDALARWLQDVAWADAEDAGVADEGFWVARRTRLRVDQAPAFREDVAARTWCSGVGRVWAERRTELRGDHGARADASALWVFVDLETARPRSASDVLADGYAEAAGGRRVAARLRHPRPPADAPREPWRLRATELDVAGHVNNAACWAAVEELLARGDGPVPAAVDVEVEYHAPTEAGEGFVIHDDEAGGLWLLGPDGELHASALIRRR